MAVLLIMFIWGDTTSILDPVHTFRMKTLQYFHLLANVNHAGLPVSSWYKKAIVPMFSDGMIVNFIESLQQFSQSLKTIKVVSSLPSTTYCYVVFECKAVNPWTEVYQDKRYGVMHPIDVEEANTFCENGYKTMLQSFIDEFCKKRRSWVIQAEVYMLQFLDIKADVPIAAFLFSEEGTSDDAGFEAAAARKPLDNAKKGVWFQITKVIQ